MERNWYKISQYEYDTPTTEYSSVCYHGTSFSPEEGMFDELDEGDSDYEAVWVTPDEKAAEEFSEKKIQEGHIRMVLKGRVELEKAAVINEGGEWIDFLQETKGVDVTFLGEAVPYFQQEGCDGWIATGSVGTTVYEDIAVFGGSLLFTEAKVFVDGQWTGYEPISFLLERYEAPDE